MSPDDPAFRQRLSSWLSTRLDGATITIDAVVPPKSGYSAETMVIDATVDGASQRFVLRRETPDPAVYPVQNASIGVEIEVQYRAMSAIASAAAGRIPIAPLLGFETDPDVLGMPFFVMRHVAGDVPVENPIYTAEGFFASAAPEQRRTLIDDGLRVLAELHRLEWRTAGFEWLDTGPDAPGVARQLRLWSEYAERELAGRGHPAMDAGLTWLRDHLPAPGPISISWGDGRPGNIIWHDFRAVCATDFEAVSLAEPEHDLGWWLMFDRWSHEAMGVPRLDGEPTRDEQRAMYETHAGRAVSDIHWHETFAAYRYAAIVVRVMNRMVDRGQMPADNTYWRENHAVACLAQLLAED